MVDKGTSALVIEIPQGVLQPPAISIHVIPQQSADLQNREATSSRADWLDWPADPPPLARQSKGWRQLLLEEDSHLNHINRQNLTC